MARLALVLLLLLFVVVFVGLRISWESVYAEVR